MLKKFIELIKNSISIRNPEQTLNRLFIGQYGDTYTFFEGLRDQLQPNWRQMVQEKNFDEEVDVKIDVFEERREKCRQYCVRH